MQLQLRSFEKLIIEIKEDNEEFEVYNPNLMVVKVIKYVEGESYDFKKLESLPTQCIEINKKEQTVSDLEKIVSDMYDIP